MRFPSIPVLAAAAVLLPVAASCAPSHPAVKVAMVQMEIGDGELAVNMQRAEQGIRWAAAKGADLVCLPEAADFGWLYQQARRDAFPIPGTYTQFLSGLARECGVWICAGCLEHDGANTYNSAVIIDRAGRIVLKQRKIKTLPSISEHLYDPGKVEDIRTVDTEFGRIGMDICADNFTISIPRRIAKLGAWLLVTPHGFAAQEKDLETNGKAFQEHICTVALATGMWVVGTDTVLGKLKGGVWKGKPHSGCSTIATPQGAPAIVGKFKRPDMVLYEIPAEN